MVYKEFPHQVILIGHIPRNCSLIGMLMEGDKNAINWHIAEGPDKLSPPLCRYNVGFRSICAILTMKDTKWYTLDT